MKTVGRQCILHKLYGMMATLITCLSYWLKTTIYIFASDPFKCTIYYRVIVQCVQICVRMLLFNEFVDCVFNDEFM